MSRDDRKKLLKFLQKFLTRDESRTELDRDRRGRGARVGLERIPRSVWAEANHNGHVRSALRGIYPARSWGQGMMAP
jgi:hypothetical protein